MDRVAVLKGMMTKAWNTGKYKTYEEFKEYIEKDFRFHHKMNFMEWVLVMPYMDIVCSKPPIIKKDKKPVKKNHDRWYVYFYFTDESNIPKYIGKTYNVESRLKEHKRDDPRFKDVKHILISIFNTEKDALDFEAYYTRHLQPEWNVDNKETPSKLYKLPAQKVQIWVPTFHGDIDSLYSREYKEWKAEIKLGQEVLEPTFQAIINSVSA